MKSVVVTVACLGTCLVYGSNACGQFSFGGGGGGGFLGGRGGGGVIGSIGSSVSGTWHQAVGGAQHAGGAVSGGVHHAGGVVSGGVHHAAGVASSGAKHAGGVVSGGAKHAGGVVSGGMKHAGGMASAATHHAGGMASIATHHAGGVASDPIHRLGNQVGNANPELRKILKGPGTSENTTYRETYQGGAQGAATGAAAGAVFGPGAVVGAVGGAIGGGVEGFGQGVFDTNKNLFESNDPGNYYRPQWVPKPNTNVRLGYQAGLKAAAGTAVGDYFTTGVGAASLGKSAAAGAGTAIAQNNPAIVRDAVEGGVVGSAVGLPGEGFDAGAVKGIYDANRGYIEARITPGATEINAARGAAQGAAIGATVGVPGADIGATQAVLTSSRPAYALRSSDLSAVVHRSTTALRGVAQSDPRRPEASHH